MKLLYLSRSRAEELPMLERLYERGKINLTHFDITHSSNLNKLKNYYEVLRFSAKHHPDVVFSEGAGLNAIIGLLASKIGKCALVFRVKGDPYQQVITSGSHSTFAQNIYRHLNLWAFNIALRHCTMILPISRKIKNTLQAQMPVLKPMRVVYIPMRDLKDIQGEEPPPLHDKIFVITVSNFQFLNKINPLIEAIPAIAPVLKSLGVTWYILGNGEYLQDIEDVVNKTANDDIIKLTGRVNPLPYYKHAKAHLYISGMDAVPNALLESFSLQLPVAVNEDFPAKDIAIKGYNVLTLPRHNDEQLAITLQNLLYSNEVRLELVNNSDTLLSEHFSVESLSDSLWKALSDIKSMWLSLR